MYRYNGQRSFGNNNNRQEQSNFGGRGGRDRYGRPDNRNNDRNRDERGNQSRFNNSTNNASRDSSGNGSRDRNGSSAGRPGDSGGNAVTQVDNGSKSGAPATTAGSSSSTTAASNVSMGSSNTNLTVVSASSPAVSSKANIASNVNNSTASRSSGNGAPTLTNTIQSSGVTPALNKYLASSTVNQISNSSSTVRSGLSAANANMSNNSINPSSTSASMNPSKNMANNPVSRGASDRGHASARNEPSKSDSGHWQRPTKDSNDMELCEEDQAVVPEEPVIPPKRKFTGRCRLFVGNLTNDVTEEEFAKMFEPFGEISENFLNSARGFGFVRLDTRHNAENARAALDGKLQKGRFLRVRFAAHGAALRVKYLSQHVSNEMLEDTFSMFGDVERAVVVVDDRGRPTGDGIVEFARKPGALAALKRISEGVFLMTSSLRPIAVEPLEDRDEIDGLPEIFFQKSGDLLQDREQPPRFAPAGSVEHEYGQKWKNLYQMYKEREEMLKRNFEEEVNKLEQDQETAKLEMHAAELRRDLQRRQEELRRFEEQAQQEVQRRQEIRMMEEERKRKELEMVEARRRQSDMMHLQQKEQMRQVQQHQHQVLQQKQQDWQQQEWQQQQQAQLLQQQLREGGGGRIERVVQPLMLGTAPAVAGVNRPAAQGINVIGAGEAAIAAGSPQQLMAGQQAANLRQIRYDPQAAGLGASGGNMARELGGKSTLSAVQGNEEYFDPKRMRRF